MDKERLAKLANRIEKYAKPIDGVGFNIGNWVTTATINVSPSDYQGHECKTTGCIAGHAIMQKYEETGRYRGQDFSRYWRLGYTDPSEYAAEYLGLDSNQAWDLFMDGMEMEPTPAEAAQAVRNMAEHGVADWDGIKRTRDESN